MRWFSPALVVGMLTTNLFAVVPNELTDYVDKKDKVYTWKTVSTTDTPAGQVIQLEMVSQEWQGIVWKHGIQIFWPKNTKKRDTMVLYNTGGNPSPSNALLGLAIAERVQSPIAFLYNIPNQPIYGKTEDGLIAETYCKYLETKDATWPLLFPMVKSVVRCMDTLQSFAKKEWDFELKQFVITGASKRGWTSWLSAATGDPRVKAIAPMVIDTLNMREQMPHQLESYGAFSNQIKDYTERGLVNESMNMDPTAKKLWAMVDPYSYREKIKIPKMIINGANDPYWTLDALNLYWDGLEGPKNVLYVPNAGHGLEQDFGNGKKNRDRVLNTLSAFSRSIIEEISLPEMSWKYSDMDSNPTLKVQGGTGVKSIRLWICDSETKDFRKATWKEQLVTDSQVSCQTKLVPSANGYRAVFAECEYKLDNLTYTLSSQIQILPPKK